jgi:hypothetical protein
VEGLLQAGSLEKMLVNNAQGIRWPEYTFPASHVGLGIRKLDFSTKGLNLELLLNASIGFSSTQLDKKKSVRYYLNTDQKIGREMPFSGQLDWQMINAYISKLAQEKLKNPRVKIHIDGEGKDYMRAQINGFKGSKSELLIDFVPVIFEKNQIGFQIIRQELKGLSFPNSLFKNNAYKRINRLAYDFKFDLMKSKDLLSNFSGSVMPNNTNLGIDVMQWNESGFYVSGILSADLKISK